MKKFQVVDGMVCTPSRKGLSQFVGDDLIITTNTPFGTPLFREYEYDEAQIKEINGKNFVYAKAVYVTKSTTFHQFTM
jgi:hypothetical protein